MNRALIEFDGQLYSTDLSKPIDISIPLSPSGPRAWYVEPMRITPVRTERFTGSVAEGGAVNFRDISFNPHGHGTHTETSGHIDLEANSINQVLTKYVFFANLVSLAPQPYQGEESAEMKRGDLVISKEVVAAKFPPHFRFDAVIVRTLPNGKDKLSKDYSNSNPPYFTAEALHYLRKAGVKHLLTDLPSVDREQDGGALLAHRAFWRSGFDGDKECTITEFIYVPDDVQDGNYMLHLQIAPFENDASPSRPVLYDLRYFGKAGFGEI